MRVAPVAGASRRARRLGLVLAATLLALGVSELALRSVLPQTTFRRLLMKHPAMSAPSATLPVVLRAGYRGRLVRHEFETRIEINSLGLRSPEIDPGKSARPRVLVVGDSFTFGWGVEAEQAYPARLERELEERHGLQVQVLNAGFASGYYPDCYYLYLREQLPVLKPDLVIVGFFVGNDIDHPGADENVWSQVDAQGLPLRIVSRDSHVDSGFWVSRRLRLRYRIPLLRHSHLFQLLAEGASRLGRVVERQQSEALDPESAVPLVYRKSLAPRTVERVALVERLFGAMQRLCERASSDLLVLVIPDLNQAEPALAPAIRERGELEKPQRLFGAFFERQGIAHLDVLEPIRAASRVEPLYYRFDWHLNARGHEVVARELAEAVAPRLRWSSGGQRTRDGD